jgi:hypothetical protein
MGSEPATEARQPVRQALRHLIPNQPLIHCADAGLQIAVGVPALSLTDPSPGLRVEPGGCSVHSAQAAVVCRRPFGGELLLACDVAGSRMKVS